MQHILIKVARYDKTTNPSILGEPLYRELLNALGTR